MAMTTPILCYFMKIVVLIWIKKKVYFSSGTWVLWSPCTQEYQRLPAPDQEAYHEALGFGYDCSTQLYKVVRAPSRLQILNIAASSGWFTAKCKFSLERC
ncbi:conserved hypothetical protein [Ricinus communis]|uniref:Uncharacterized protein n=1 Tax=Ricinus communis TaxID=3988 RepID=B9RCX2_RICCO|nr:conserved hypothetical protein [Ricinus communis]